MAWRSEKESNSLIYHFFFLSFLDNDNIEFPSVPDWFTNLLNKEEGDKNIKIQEKFPVEAENLLYHLPK